MVRAPITPTDMKQEERDKLMAVLPNRFEVKWDDERQGSCGETTVWDTDNEMEHEFSKLTKASMAIGTLLRQEERMGFSRGQSDVRHGVKLALGLK